MEDSRVSQISNFTATLADIQISRHPLKSLAIIVFNNTSTDHYLDTTNVESSRNNKLVVVERDADKYYVQEWIDDDSVFLDDEDRTPWLITFTLSSLDRTPKKDDFIIVEGRKYSISRVKPINSRIKTVVTCLVYPEKTNQLDPFSLKGVKFYINYKLVPSKPSLLGEEVVVEITYGGYPVKFSKDGADWVDFHYKYRTIIKENSKVYIKDSSNVIRQMNLL